MPDIELQSCPFCGGTAYSMTVEISSDYADFYEAYIVACKTSWCRGGYSNCWYDTPQEAAEAWNRRASPWRTDPPPKNGSEILGMFQNGPRVVFWDCWDVGGDYDCPPDGLECGWCYAGDEIIYEVAEPTKWMEIPE